MPSVARLRRLAAQTVDVSLTELKTPLSDSLIAKGDAAHRQHFFHIAEAQGEAKIQPNAMTNDLGREAMTRVKRNGRAHS